MNHSYLYFIVITIGLSQEIYTDYLIELEDTIDELKKAGYSAITSEDYINNYNHFNETDEKFIITIEGSELSRGRGGPRCLTLPLFRL